MCRIFELYLFVWNKKSVKKIVFKQEDKQPGNKLLMWKTGLFVYHIHVVFMACMVVNAMVVCNVNNFKFSIPLFAHLFFYECHCCYNLITRQIIDHIKSFKYISAYSKQFRLNPQLDNNINITTQPFPWLGNAK